MAPTLRDIRQREAIRAFIRLGGVEKRHRGKGSHRYVWINGRNVTIPGGIISIGTLKYILKCAGISDSQFLEVV